MGLNYEFVMFDCFFLHSCQKKSPKNFVFFKESTIFAHCMRDKSQYTKALLDISRLTEKT